LAEEHIQGSTGNNDIAREGFVSDANSSRGARMRDPIQLTPKILAMVDRHEPNKSKHAKLLTKHLAGQRVLPITEKELQQHLERKAKRDADRILDAVEEKANRQEQLKQADTAPKAMNVVIAQTIAKRAREAALGARATPEAAEAAATTAATDAETTFAENAMQE